MKKQCGNKCIAVNIVAAVTVVVFMLLLLELLFKESPRNHLRVEQSWIQI